jgi:hypothetical protein
MVDNPLRKYTKIPKIDARGDVYFLNGLLFLCMGNFPKVGLTLRLPAADCVLT